MLLDLPEEVALCICSFLTVKDLFSLACVCRQMSDVTMDPVLWKDLFESSSDKSITMSPPMPLSKYTDSSLMHNNNNNNNTNYNRIYSMNHYLIEEEPYYWKYLCQYSKKYDSVSAALEIAVNGSVIHIRPGNYEDNFVITKPVHIIGVGGDNTKVVIENKAGIGKVMTVNIIQDDDMLSSETVPEEEIEEIEEEEENLSIPPSLPSSYSPSPSPSSSPTLSSAIVDPLSLSHHSPSSLPLMPSIRGCTLRQRATAPPQNFCIEIISGAFLIEDCTVCSESLSCICVQKEGAPIIRRNTIYGTSAGLTTFECTEDTIVEENQFFSNSYSAIEISLYANPVVRRNHIFDGKSAGIFIFDHGRGLIHDNNIYGNTSSGIEVAREATPIVRRNKIHHGKGCGISVYDKSAGVFQENEIYENFESNIYISRHANPIFARNKIYRSKLSGVYIHNEGAGFLEDNEIFENMNEGVATVDESNPKLINNLVRDNKRAGIVVYDKGMGHFEKNIVKNNVGGIEVRRMGKPILIDNVLIDNEIVPQELRACIERGECTFSATGVSFFPQYWWYCDTCEGGGDKGCCASCAMVCHKGHKISQRKFSLFYCDCGAEWCCRVMPNRKNNY